MRDDENDPAYAAFLREEEERAAALAAELGRPARCREPGYDAEAFDALPLPAKLDAAAHAALGFKMALISSVAPATEPDIQKIKAALSAAQSIVLNKTRVDEAALVHRRELHPGRDYLAEFRAIAVETRRQRLPASQVPRFDALIEQGVDAAEAERQARASTAPLESMPPRDPAPVHAPETACEPAAAAHRLQLTLPVPTPRTLAQTPSKGDSFLRPDGNGGHLSARSRR